jgi:hypothetical protein
MFVLAQPLKSFEPALTDAENRRSRSLILRRCGSRRCGVTRSTTLGASKSPSGLVILAALWTAAPAALAANARACPRN